MIITTRSTEITTKKPGTATVTVNEHNFDAASVQAAITASLEGQGIAAPSLSGFSGSGDVHTATVEYDTDGITPLILSIRIWPETRRKTTQRIALP